MKVLSENACWIKYRSLLEYLKKLVWTKYSPFAFIPYDCIHLSDPLIGMPFAIKYVLVNKQFNDHCKEKLPCLIVFYTNFISYISPNVMWGTQEMLWPLNPNIQKASERVEQLATPKKDFSTVDSKGRYVMMLIN